MSIDSAKAHIERVKKDAGGSSQVGAVEVGAAIVIIFLIGLFGVIATPVSHDIDKITGLRSATHVIDENIERGP
ncbi:MAG: hypothetical protein H8E17_04520 [Deltaproteobacteria bacterium]|nr:hypothetical protein [Deltaproteobacteria bacterium]